MNYDTFNDRPTFLTRKYDRFLELYEKEKVTLLSVCGTYGPELVPGSFYAVISSDNGYIHVSRALLESQNENGFDCVTDDGRNKPLTFSTFEDTYLLIRLEDDFHTLENFDRASSMRLSRNSVAELEIGAEYLLSNDYRNIRSRGRFLGTVGSYNGINFNACFSNGIFSLIRETQVFVNEVNPFENALLSETDFQAELNKLGITFDPETDSYIENRKIVSGVDFRNMLGRKVSVVTIEDNRKQETKIFLNSVTLNSFDEKKGLLHFHRIENPTDVKGKKLAILLHKENRFDKVAKKTKKVMYACTYDFREATDFLRSLNIVFNPDTDAYLINGEVDIGAPLEELKNKRVKVISFGHDGAFEEIRSDIFTGTNNFQDLVFKNYGLNIASLDRALAVITQ